MEIGKEEPQSITDEKELMDLFIDIQTRCLKLENFEEPGMTVQEMIEKLMIVLKSIKDLQLFSPNQTLKEVHTEYLKYLLLPYHLGWLYGRVRDYRMKAVLSSKEFLSSFLGLIDQFSCEEEQIFPKNLKKIWQAQTKQPGYRPPRDELIQAMKDRKIAEKRYENWLQIKDEQDRRQALKDFITIQVHQSVSMLRNIEEEIGILKYKQSLEKDPEVKEQHENQLTQPIPKMKVWKIPPKEEIHSYMCPEHAKEQQAKTKKELIAQVWQENANKPTMTLSQVGDLEIQNARQRSEREAKQRQENKEDTDSDKEVNDDRMKKKARAWDDWKDDHEKGAGNRNGR